VLTYILYVKKILFDDVEQLEVREMRYTDFIYIFIIDSGPVRATTYSSLNHAWHKNWSVMGESIGFCFSVLITSPLVILPL
jgi:hypothetical protein